MPHREIGPPTEKDTIVHEHSSQSQGGVVRGWVYRRPGLTASMIYVEMRQYPPPPDPNTFFFTVERKLGRPTVVGVQSPGRRGSSEAFMMGIVAGFEAVVHEAEAKYPTKPVEMPPKYTQERAREYTDKREPGEIDKYRAEMVASDD